MNCTTKTPYFDELMLQLRKHAVEGRIERLRAMKPDHFWDKGRRDEIIEELERELVEIRNHIGDTE